MSSKEHPSHKIAIIANCPRYKNSLMCKLKYMYYKIHDKKYLKIGYFMFFFIKYVHWV